MTRLSFASLCTSTALVGCSVFASAAAFGQSSVSVSGRALDFAGHAISNPVVRLISDTAAQPHVRPLRYTLIGDRLGKFSQEGIAPGAYLVMLSTDGKAADVLQSVFLKPGDDSVLEVNLSSRPQVLLSGAGNTLSMVANGTPLVRTR